MAIILTESSKAVEAAEIEGFGDSDTWVTTSPYVIEKLSSKGFDVRWLDNDHDGHKVHSAGALSLKVTNALTPSILEVETALEWPRLRAPAGIRIHRLLSVLIYRAMLLEEFLNQNAGDEKYIVGNTTLSPINPDTPSIGRYDTLFAIFADQSKLDDTSVLQFSEPTAGLEQLSDQPTFLTRLISLSTLTTSNLIWRVWKALGFPEINLSAGQTTVLFDGENESIREMLPALIRNRYRVRRLPKPNLHPTDTGIGAETNWPGYQDIRSSIAASIDRNAFPHLKKALLDIAAARISAFLNGLSSLKSIADTEYAKAVACPEKTLLLFGKTGTLIRHAFAARLERDGGTSVVVQHGSSASISRYHVFFEHFSEARNASFYLVNSPAAAALYNDAPTSTNWTKGPYCALPIGLPKETKSVPWRQFQRSLVRASLRLPSRSRVIMAVLGTYQNNMIYQPGMANDCAAHSLYMAVAHEIMPFVSGVPVVKLYSTQRFTDPDPLESFRKPPDPVLTLKSGDFRFLRAATDICLLDSPLSTMGWAFGAGCPLVYLYTPAFPLIDDVLEQLKEAIFVIDASHDDWIAQTIELINQPVAQIDQIWNDKRLKRDQFVDRYISPPLSVGDAAAALLTTLPASH